MCLNFELEFKVWIFFDKDFCLFRMYLQHPLNDTVGKAIKDDFVAFNWEWLESVKKKHNWGSPSSNLLYVGMEGELGKFMTLF